MRSPDWQFVSTYLSARAQVLSLSLSDICGLQCQIIRCQNWSHSAIPSNLPINSLYLHDQQDLIRLSSMKCWDSFDKSNMLLIFLLNQKCCAAEKLCCYQFLLLLSGVTKISGHTTPHHTFQFQSVQPGEDLSLEDCPALPCTALPCRAGNDRTPFLASSSSLSQTWLPEGGPHSHSPLTK